MRIIRLDEVKEQGVSHNPEIRKRVMIERGQVEHLSNFSRAVLKQGQRARSHAHADMYEVFFVESGDCVIKVNDEEFAIGAGTCVTVEPGETHEIVNSGRRELVLLYFGLER